MTYCGDFFKKSKNLASVAIIQRSPGEVGDLQFRIEIGETAIDMGAHYSAHLSAQTPASYHPGTEEWSKRWESWSYLLSDAHSLPI